MATSPATAIPPHRPLSSRTTRITLLFIAIAFLCAGLGDLAITSINPWEEMGRLAIGLLTPDLTSLGEIAEVLLSTIAFALLGVFLGSTSGFVLALFFHNRLVRVSCAFVRAIHELFWALIFLQFFGLHPVTGLLAIAIPYAGIFAKVYSEILEESETSATQVVPQRAGALATFLYAKVPDALPHLITYTSYRLECGLRSSAVLGFVGLPTLGFLLESAFGEGHYSEVGAMLLVFYLIIATLRFWVRRRLLPFYLLAAPFLLGGGLPIVWSNVSRFWTEDIIPSPLRSAEQLWSLDTLQAMGHWLGDLLWTQALPGIWNTLLLTQIALVVTGALTLLFFPVISRWLGNRLTQTTGHWFLVIARSTPEYILAYILLQLWGPSMLPAVVALALHNGAIIGHLIGRQSNELPLRQDRAKGLNLYFFELVPGLYRSFLAFLFYRWEIIMRETAILGILGIHTLGFYVDSAIQDIRFDRAFVLILITAILNIAVDAIARGLRKHLKLSAQVRCEP